MFDFLRYHWVINLFAPAVSRLIQFPQSGSSVTAVLLKGVWQVPEAAQNLTRTPLQL